MIVKATVELQVRSPVKEGNIQHWAFWNVRPQSKAADRLAELRERYPKAEFRAVREEIKDIEDEQPTGPQSVSSGSDHMV